MVRGRLLTKVRRHGWAAVALLCAVVPSAAGCTAVAGKPSVRDAATGAVRADVRAASPAPSCSGGAFRWSSVHRGYRLTEISPVVTDDRKGGWITFRLGLVRNIVPRVDTSDGSVSAHRVLVALAGHLSEGLDAEQLAAPGEESADRDHTPARVEAVGNGQRLVEAEGVLVVEASFTVTCPGRDVHGSVTTWFGNAEDSIACGVDPGEHAMPKEAYELACGPLPLRR
ncbi:hypothetical protein ACFC00_33910 [Streptomyces adustus]|uniref:hypothetical protein n=1 Tax=Streptomyces adustus TaxID=1609272 RepID=UPI0035DD3CB8